MMISMADTTTSNNHRSRTNSPFENEFKNEFTVPRLPSASVGNARNILVSTKKTDTRDECPERGDHGSDSDIFCPYHKSSNHTLNDCLVFRMKSEDKRTEF